MRNYYFLKSLQILAIIVLLLFGGGCKPKTITYTELEDCCRMKDSLDKLRETKNDSSSDDSLQLKMQLIEFILSYQGTTALDSFSTNKKWVESASLDKLFNVSMKLNDEHSICLNKKFVEWMDRAFEKHYKGDINTVYEDNHTFFVSWSLVKNYIDFNNIKKDPTLGIGLYYVISGTAPNEIFSYVIAKAKKTHEDGKDTIKPLGIPIAGGEEIFLLLTNSSEPNNYSVINKLQFQSYAAKYRQSIQLKSDGVVYNVRELNHPYVCFHVGDSMHKFYNDNYGLASTLSNLQLLIRTGLTGDDLKLTHSNGNSYYLNLQTPLIIFGENQQPFLDNVPAYDGKPYKNKALDVGSLCPPECN